MRERNTTNPELRSALERLFSLQTFGIKLGLEPITLLLDEFGNPHRSFPTIHVAGTNGKGSVCAMLASVMRERGLRVGLYTSPHLVDFSERIRVDGAAIDEERLALYAREMMPAIERIGCTFFEGTTAMGFRFFAEESVDIAIVETGMGGRLDATNVVDPIITAITSISLDHTRHLGNTLEEIALEKAGIMKRGVPAVVGHVSPRLRRVFELHAEQVGATLTFSDDVTHAIYRAIDYDSTIASFIVGRGAGARAIADVSIGLVGRHQIENARAALTVLEQLEAYRVDEATVRKGLRDVRVNTSLRGRFERVSEDPPIVIDVAHNEDGARVLADTLSLINGGARNARFVYGCVEDKDVTEILRMLAPIATHLHAVRADSPRSIDADEIRLSALDAGIEVSVDGSVRRGVEHALRDRAPGEVIVVCGSFFVAGEAYVALDELAQRDASADNANAERDPSADNANAVRDPSADNANGGRDASADNANDDNSASDATNERRADSGDGSRVRDSRFASSSVSVSEDHIVPYGTNRGRSTGDAQRKLTVKEWSESEQPRERLMSQGATALSDAELLAIVMRTGTKQHDVLSMCRKLLEHFCSDPANESALHRLAQRDYKELQAVSGIGPTKALTLAAAFELGRRATALSFGRRPRIGGPRDIAAIFIPELRHIQKEQFHVVILNTANQVVRRVLVSEGSLNSSIVHPREVFRHAIVESGAAIIGLHNHPSGNPMPSREDIAITKQLVEAGRIIGIQLHDHIIIAGEEFVSMAEKGYV